MLEQLCISIQLTFLLPFIASLILFFLDRRKADIVMLTFLTASLISYFYALALYLDLGRAEIHIKLFESSGTELFGLIIDKMSMLISFVVITAGFAFMLYSVEYMSPRNKEHPIERGKGRFYGWMMLFISATLAFIFSSSVLQLLMFFELMSLSCWGVVSFYLTSEAHRAALKAFITTHVGALLGLFIAIALSLSYVGDLSLYSLGRAPYTVKTAIFVAFLVSAITKSAQFPTYSWLPDAMVAPTPASAFLHGAAMIEMGVYLLARGIQFLGSLPIECSYILLTIVSLTLITTAILYIPQRDAKRLLAYSTIAESGSMYAALVPACLGIERGVLVSMYILALHAYVKGLGFLTTGLFSYYLGEKTIDRVQALLRISPFMAFCWIFALLGLAGVPPMPLFFAKLKLFTVVMQGVEISPYLWILVAALFLDIVSFGIVALKWIHRTVLSEVSDIEVKKIEIHPVLTLSLIILIAFSFVIPYIANRFLGC